MDKPELHNEIMSALSNFGGRLGAMEATQISLREDMSEVKGDVKNLLRFKDNIEGKISVMTMVLVTIVTTVLGAVAFVSKWAWDKLMNK